MSTMSVIAFEPGSPSGVRFTHTDRKGKHRAWYEQLEKLLKYHTEFTHFEVLIDGEYVAKALIIRKWEIEYIDGGFGVS